jgi:hypothetical protein
MFIFIYLMFQNRDDDPLDPMDPAAYSDVPRGTWTTGTYPQWAKIVLKGHFLRASWMFCVSGTRKLRVGNRAPGSSYYPRVLTQKPRIVLCTAVSGERFRRRDVPSYKAVARRGRLNKCS